MLIPSTSSRSQSMVIPVNIILKRAGSSVADGRMALPLGKSCLTSKSPILFKLLSLQYKWVLLLSLVSTGGYSIS